ncbi:MAG: VanW family protein [Clostridia bacterium]|nr:VanW family protein [Clostridia bacterium]
MRAEKNEKNTKNNSESKKPETVKKEAEKKEEPKMETKEEKVVFKNNDKKEEKPAPKKEAPTKMKKDEKAEEAKAEILEKKENSKRKAGAVAIILIVILVTILVFSTIFAMVFSTKNTIARGVKINNIDVSGLTLEEARTKLNGAFKTILDVDIDLNYKDYNYKIKSDDVELSYNFQNELEQAYSIGRTGNILERNYRLIATAIKGEEYNIRYEYSETDVNAIVEKVATSMPGLVTQYSYYIEDDELIINPGVDGIQVEQDSLKNRIENNLQNRNPLEIIKDFKNEKLTIPCKNVTADPVDMEKVYSEVHTQPENAYFIPATETSKAQIFADVDGIDFAISVDEAKETYNEETNEYVVPLSKTKAEITINDIGLEAFPNKLQEFSTRYDASNWGRSENLKIATRKIDGTVLMPGQQFSFNGVVGERTVQEGYKNAAIFSNGTVEDGLAGGICQISSTLYNVALLANLQIDERYNHSFKTSYLDYGRDATVVYGIKDFKFTNTRSYPIKIDGTAENGVVTFAIYGIEEDTEYTIKVLPVVTSTIPYTTQTVTDNSLAPGAQAVKQGGQSGARVTTYKETSLNGVVISKEVITNDVYQAMTRIVRVGPNATPVSAPSVETPVAPSAPVETPSAPVEEPPVVEQPSAPVEEPVSTQAETTPETPTEE